MKTWGNILSKIFLLWSFTLPAQCLAIISKMYRQAETTLSMAMFVDNWVSECKVCADKNYASFGSNVFPIEKTFCNIFRKAFLHIDKLREITPFKINKEFDDAWMGNSLYALNLKYQKAIQSKNYM